MYASSAVYPRPGTLDLYSVARPTAESLARRRHLLLHCCCFTLSCGSLAGDRYAFWVSYE